MVELLVTNRVKEDIAALPDAFQKAVLDTLTDLERHLQVFRYAPRGRYY